MLKPILLVEDNPHDLELTLIALSKSQLANEVVIVRDGAEALDYLHRRGEFRERVIGNPAVMPDEICPRQIGEWPTDRTGTCNKSKAAG